MNKTNECGGVESKFHCNCYEKSVNGVLVEKLLWVDTAQMHFCRVFLKLWMIRSKNMEKIYFPPNGTRPTPIKIKQLMDFA